MGDLNTTHVKSSIVDSVIATIESHFEKMTVTRGKKCTHARIEIEFIGNMKVNFFRKIIYWIV